MKFKYKTLMPILLLVLMALSCYFVVNTAVSTKKEYDSYIQEAADAMDKDIDIDVDEAFTKAIDVKSVPDVYIQWANYYYNKKDYAKSVLICQDAQTSFSREPSIYLILMKSYLAQEAYKEFFDTYKKCKTVKSYNDDIQALYEKNQYVFSLDTDNYIEAYPFSNGIARVKRESYSDEKEYYGFIGNSGSIPAQYTDAGDFNADEISVAPVVSSNGDTYYINTDGMKKYVVKPKKITVKKLGFYSCGVLSVFDGKQYYLSDIKSNIIAGPFDYVSTINQNVGVVRESGKWKIINEKGEQIANRTFSDVILDSKEIAFRGAMFVSDGSGYYLINEKGEKIGNQVYDDAKLFIELTMGEIR